MKLLEDGSRPPLDVPRWHLVPREVVRFRDLLKVAKAVLCRKHENTVRVPRASMPKAQLEQRTGVQLFGFRLGGNLLAGTGNQNYGFYFSYLSTTKKT